MFGLVGLGAVVVGVLHFAGVFKAGTAYGVLWCVGGIPFLWVTGRVVYGVRKEVRTGSGPGG
jgi:hypothetical protein